MPRVGDPAAPNLLSPVTPVSRYVTRRSSAQLQGVTTPKLVRSHSAGKKSDHPRTPTRSPSKPESGSPQNHSIRRHRSADGHNIRSTSDDSQRRRRKSSGETALKKSPSRRRTVTRSLAGLEISVELQEAQFPSNWIHRKSQLFCKAYALKSSHQWVEKAVQPVVMVGKAFSLVVLHLSLSCEEAKDFLKSDEDYKPIEIRVYDGIQFRGSILLPLHTAEPTRFVSVNNESPFEVCARITLEGSTMHELEAGSVLENIPVSCNWHCKLPISVLAITKKHGLVQWEESLRDTDLKSKSGTLERVATLLHCNLNKFPASVATLLFVVVNESAECVTCRIEQGVGLGRMTVLPNQTVILGRVTVEAKGFELMSLMQSFPIVSDLGALIPIVHHCARDVVDDPLNVRRTAWMRPGDCIQLRDYCPQLTSLVVDIRCKKGDVMAIFLDERGQRVDVVDKHHTKSRDRSATMNRKMVELELQRVGKRVQTIAFITTADFACHVWNPATEAQLIRFADCPDELSLGNKHIIVGCFIRSEESFWNFWALGLPTKSNSLHTLCEYVHNLHPSPSPPALFPIEPFDVPAKVYLDKSEGLIPADQLLKGVKVSQ